MLITITGKSGSGKSCISEYLAEIDSRIVTLHIDKIGHRVIEKSDVAKRIIREFNLNPNSEKVSRDELGEIVFNNRNKMKMLSDITWSFMEQDIEEFIKDDPSRIIILDWLLIPRTDFFKKADLNILVTASFDERLKRAMKRDNITREKFIEREKASIDFNQNDFDYIINNEEKEQTKRMVKKIYDKSIISR